MKGLWKHDAMMIAAVLLALGLHAGYMADRDVEITAEAVKKADERKAVKPEDRTALSSPMDCDAVVIHSGTPGELPRTRCYVRKSAR